MNEDIKKLFEQLQETTTELRSYVDRKVDEATKTGAPRADTVAAIEKINADLTELRGKYDDAIKAVQRPKLDPQGKELDPQVELRKAAFTKFLRYGAGETGRTMMSPEEVRALSSATDADGGFLVPPAWEAEVLMNAYNEAEIRPTANVASTGRDQVFMPALSKPSVAWGVANVAVTEQDLNAGGERIQIFDLKALSLIHNNTLDDSDADVWGELQTAFAAAIAEAEDVAFAVGGGAVDPQGVLSHAGVLARYKLTGVAAAIFDSTHNGVDALINMLYNLKKTYRRNATWAMNSTTEGAVRQLKDEQGQYLWAPPVAAGAPATLLGRPIVNPEGLPDIAANAYPIVLGDFRAGYRIRDRAGITVQRLVERYAEYDQTGFLIKRRTGGKVVKAEAFTVLKVAAS
jgi:HK97 family phage major capsid protein